MSLGKREMPHARRQSGEKRQGLGARQRARRPDRTRRQSGDGDTLIVERRLRSVEPYSALELVDLDAEGAEKSGPLLLAGIEPAQEVGGARVPVGSAVEQVVDERPGLRLEDRPLLHRVSRTLRGHAEDLAQRQERRAAQQLEILGRRAPDVGDAVFDPEGTVELAQAFAQPERRRRIVRADEVRGVALEHHRHAVSLFGIGVHSEVVPELGGLESSDPLHIRRVGADLVGIEGTVVGEGDEQGRDR